MKRFLLAYFLFCFSFFTLFSSGFVDSQDGFQYLAVARRMYYDQTFELPIESFDTGENIHLSISRGYNNGSFSPTGLGLSLALLPAVLVEDIFLKTAGVSPISAFPLENDWPVLLIASMTNAFFGAILAVTMYSWLKLYNFKDRTAIFLSFISVVATNVFPHTKHVFAHMMFTSFLTISFYLIKKHSTERKWQQIYYAALAFGIMAISYNPTYFLPLPALGLYYLLTHYQSFSWDNVKQFLKDGVVAFGGILLPAMLYFWFNQVRFSGIVSTGYGGKGITIPGISPAYVIVEGIWGLLFSPGKSIFVYTPLFLILLLFWFRLKKKFLAEIVAFLTLFLIYLYYMGTLLGGADFLVWHGDSSWGPRYMVQVIPLAMILVSLIYRRMKLVEKWIVFYPLMVLGITIQLLGMLLPYQIRFAGLQTDTYFNGRNFNVYEYGNEIPRYAPWFKMSKTLYKRVKGLREAYDHGPYQLRLFDGFNYPFDLGWTKWREPMPQAYLSFVDNQSAPVQKLALQFRNHPIKESQFPAKLEFFLNGQALEQDLLIEIDQEGEVVFDSLNLVSDEPNILEIKTSFVGTDLPRLKKKQVVFLQILRINDLPQNISTIDYPYVSPISESLFGANYQYWGKGETDPWSIWHMHSGVYEQTFDLWWLRPLHYWDFPRKLFLAGLGINLTTLTLSAYFLFRSLSNKIE